MFAAATPPSCTKDFRLLRAIGGRGVYASAGPLFRSAVFGRDSLEVAEDLLDTDPGLAREVLLTLARAQGVREHAPSEEQPGRIHHEWRRAVWGEAPVCDSSLAILTELSSRWGGTDTELIYYGSADATPLFCRVASRYLARYGEGILSEPVRQRDGSTVSFKASVRAACNWVADQIEASELGLLEFHRHNPDGLTCQTWKDSESGIIHSDGHPANFNAPVATLELQGLAYDALLAGAKLGTAAETGRWREMARALPARVADQFAFDGGYPACAIDRDQVTGTPRRVTTRTSDAGAMLCSELLVALPGELRERVVCEVAATLLGAEFLTDAGIRCRSLAYDGLLEAPSYHGCWSVWQKETYDVARGLAARGMAQAARELENRMLDAAVRAGGHYEFFWVAPDGSVAYHADRGLGGARQLTVGNIAEPQQAWTVSAVLAIKRRRGHGVVVPVAGAFERELLSQMPRVEAPRGRLRAPAQSFTVRFDGVEFQRTRSA